MILDFHFISLRLSGELAGYGREDCVLLVDSLDG